MTNFGGKFSKVQLVKTRLNIKVIIFLGSFLKMSAKHRFSFGQAQFASGFLAAALVASTIGCSDQQDRSQSRGGSSKASDIAPEPEAAGELSVLIWEDYISPEVVGKFESTHNAKVRLTEAANSEEFKQKLSEDPSAYDLVVTDERTLVELVSLRLLRSFDSKVLSGFQAVDAKFAPPKREAVQYSVPYLWGLTVLAGKKDVIPEAEPSWDLIWREDLRVGLIDEPFDLIWFGLIALGYEPETATEAQIDEVVSKLSKRFPDMTSAMFDPVTGLDALEAGELDLLITYNGDGLLRASQNSAIDIVIPREGAPIWIDSFGLTRDAQNPKLAITFITYMSLPEPSAHNANFLHYATPIRAAHPHVEKALLNNPDLYPDPSVLARCRFVRFPESLEKYVHQAAARIVTGNRVRPVRTESEPLTSAEKTEIVPED